MTPAERFDDRLGDGLADLADPRFPDYLSDVLAVTSRTRQRPAWSFPSRWLPMVDIARRRAFVPTLPWRAITVLIALLLIAGLAWAVAGSRPRVPAPFGPARNGLIAYSSFGDLYLGDPNGSSTLLLKSQDQNLDPAFSRTGTLLTFLRFDSLGLTMWTIRPDGSHLTRITPQPVADLPFWDWGPTDDTVYYSAPENGVARLHVARSDGSAAPRILAPDLAVLAFWFRPPDGREMVIRGENEHGVGLYVMNADGTNRRTLVAPDGTPPEEHDMREPRYSPDGTKIAYQHWDGAFSNMLMHVINADGSNNHVIHTPGASFEGWPVWLLDSQRLVMQQAFPTASEHLGFGHPFVVMNADGTGVARAIGPAVAGTKAELSPDGRSLLMFNEDRSTTQIVIDVESGTYAAVPWVTNSYPSWQRLAP
jgi:Tol biopolymer transport system component